MADRDLNRTEQASAKRKEQARARGQVAVSRDVSTAAVLLGGFGLLYFLTHAAMTKLGALIKEWLISAADAGVRSRLTVDHVHEIVTKAGSDLLFLLLPLVAGIAVLGVGSTVAQTGFIWKTEGLGFDLGRLNPWPGLQRIASLRSLAELSKAVLKVLFIGAAGFYAVRNDVAILPELVQYPLDGILSTLGWLIIKTALSISIAVAFVAALDYGYQRFEWERNLRMSREEVKEEHREAEGDPHIRSRIRSLQRDMARKRMLADVKKADVVVTNPDHLAVALKYDQFRMAAPVVVAKGAGYVAERIKEIAREHGVMVVENKFVARTLYKLVEVGREIPSDLYRAVAEILAFVYRVRGKVPVR